MFYLFLSILLLFFTSPYTVDYLILSYLSFISVFLNFLLLKKVFNTVKTFWSLIFSQSSFSGEIHLLFFFFFSFSSVHGIYFYQFDSEDTLQMFLSWFGYIKLDFQRYLCVNMSASGNRSTKCISYNAKTCWELDVCRTFFDSFLNSLCLSPCGYVLERKTRRRQHSE